MEYKIFLEILWPLPELNNEESVFSEIFSYMTKVFKLILKLQYNFHL